MICTVTKYDICRNRRPTQGIEILPYIQERDSRSIQLTFKGWMLPCPIGGSGPLFVALAAFFLRGCKSRLTGSDPSIVHVSPACRSSYDVICYLQDKLERFQHLNSTFATKNVTYRLCVICSANPTAAKFLAPTKGRCAYDLPRMT